MTSVGPNPGASNAVGTGRHLSVLLVCQTYPPVIGGSEIEAQRLCAGLIRRGHRVEVLCCGGPPMPASRRWNDPYGVPVRMYGSGAGKWRDRVYTAGLAWTLVTATRRFDLVYFLMQGLHVAVGVPLARMLGLPCLMKFAGSNDLTDVLKARVGRMEIAALRKWSEKLLVLNQAMTDEAIGAGFDPDKVMWAPNPVDTNEYRPCGSEAEKAAVRRELGIAGDAPVIVFVGRMAPEKELPSLISAFSIVAGQHPTARLVVVGDGPMRQQVEAHTAELGLSERVMFAGMQQPERICRWMRASDIFTLVSHREGLPVSLIEAMATGLPSVVTDLPAVTQLVEDGRHGFHARVREPESIAAGLLRLLNSPSMRAQFGAEARKVAVRGFSLETVIDTYENLFLSIAPNASRPRFVPDASGYHESV